MHFFTLFVCVCAFLSTRTQTYATWKYVHHFFRYVNLCFVVYSKYVCCTSGINKCNNNNKKKKWNFFRLKWLWEFYCFCLFVVFRLNLFFKRWAKKVVFFSFIQYFACLLLFLKFLNAVYFLNITFTKDVHYGWEEIQYSVFCISSWLLFFRLILIVYFKYKCKCCSLLLYFSHFRSLFMFIRIRKKQNKLLQSVIHQSMSFVLQLLLLLLPHSVHKLNDFSSVPKAFLHFQANE